MFPNKKKKIVHLTFMPSQLEVKYGEEKYYEIVHLSFYWNRRKKENTPFILRLKCFHTNDSTLYLLVNIVVVVRSFFLIYIQYTSILPLQRFFFFIQKIKKVPMNCALLPVVDSMHVEWMFICERAQPSAVTKYYNAF